MRKRIVLSKQIISVQKEDGDIGHIEVNINDEEFTTQQATLQALADMGEIMRSSKPSSPVPGKGNLKDVLRRGSMAVERTVSSSDKKEKIDVPKDMNEVRDRTGSTILTPALLKDLQKDRKRIIAKGGQCNLTLDNVPRKRMQFYKDLFTTAVDMKWRYTFSAFVSAFFISWLIFTVFYWITAVYRGDTMTEHLPSGLHSIESGRCDSTDNVTHPDGCWQPCVLACYDFTSYFLFSMETQHTIGYGSRQTTEKCPETIILVCLQSILGVIISSCMAGIVFAKLARPKARAHTVMFSKNAVITMRNGQFWLMFRLGNMRKSHLIESHIRAQMIYHKKVSSEGEILTYECEELDITTQAVDDEDEENAGESEWEKEDRTLFIFPTHVAHRIDKDSPFYEWGPGDILNARFEMLVTLEGIVEPTGNSVQSRSSYLPNEILWGHHYESMVSYSKKRGTYVVDCSNLNAVVSNSTPRMSRKMLEDQQAILASNKTKKSQNSAFGNSTSNNVGSNHVSRVHIDSPLSNAVSAMSNSTTSIPTSPTPTCNTLSTDIE